MDVAFWILVCSLVIIAPIALSVLVATVAGIVGMVLYSIGAFLEWVGRKIGSKK